MLHTPASIASFLNTYIPHFAAHGPVTPDTVRAGLRRHLRAEAGVHYEDAWLLVQLAHILATSPAAPRSPAAWLQDELQADRERWPGLKQPEGADCETAPPGGSGAGASGPTDGVPGSATASGLLDPAPEPSAEPPTAKGPPRAEVEPIVDAYGRDITSIELIIPIGAKPGGFFSFSLHPGARNVPRMIAEVPALAKPGEAITFGHAVWWPRHGRPAPSDYQLYPVPKAKTLNVLLDGFSDMPAIPPGTPIEHMPIVVFNVPKPRLGDDLQCFQHRFSEWTLVEAHGVPQPGAWAHHERGSTYEAFLLQQNLGKTPKEFGYLPDARLLRLLHLKTRSVCESRLVEWKQGERWALRDDHEGAYQPLSFLCITPLDAKRVRTRAEPCVGAPDMVKTRARWQRERELEEAEEQATSEAFAQAFAAREVAKIREQRELEAAKRKNAAAKGRGRAAAAAAAADADGLAAAAPASKKRSADDALAASGLTAAVHAFASASGPAMAPIASVPYAAWSAEKAAAAPTSSHDRQAPRMTQYEATSWREAEKLRRAYLRAEMLQAAARKQRRLEYHAKTKELEQRLDSLALTSEKRLRGCVARLVAKGRAGAQAPGQTRRTVWRTHGWPSPMRDEATGGGASAVAGESVVSAEDDEDEADEADEDEAAEPPEPRRAVGAASAIATPMLISEDAINNFLCEFIPRAYLAHGTATPDMVREALGRFGAVAGTHYEDAWLVAQLERILAAIEADEDEDESDGEEAYECSEVDDASSDDDEAAEPSAVDEALERISAERAWKATPLGPPLPSEPLLGGLGVGAEVTAIGLQTSAPLNGLEGLVIGFDLDAARYIVLLQGHAESFGLLPANLKRTKSGSRPASMGHDATAAAARAPYANVELDELLKETPLSKELEAVAAGPDGAAYSSGLSLLASLVPVADEVITATGTVLHTVSNPAFAGLPEVLIGEAADEADLPIAD
ncbi:hypothetical protein Ctob_016428, partial [Chrysochromulina tobinii]